MNPEFAVELVKTMLFQALALAAPILLTAMVIGLGVSLFQAVTSIHEQTLSFVPKVLGIILLLILILPWMVRSSSGWRCWRAGSPCVRVRRTKDPAARRPSRRSPPDRGPIPVTTESSPPPGRAMEKSPKQSWVPPEIRRYGTFAAATQACDKKLGGSDGYTFMGSPIVCAS